MPIARLAHDKDFEGWRAAARVLAWANVPSAEIEWQIGERGLFDEASETSAAASNAAFAVPRAFLTLAETVIRHSDPERFGLLYAALLRLRARPQDYGEGGQGWQRLERMAQDVRREDVGKKHGETALTGKMTGKSEDLRDAIAAERRLQPGGNRLAAWKATLKEARGCRRCHLYRQATQTVFGEGPLDARIMFVGEQPGDQEDLQGRPFVGPAGQLFDRALAEAGIDRTTTYVSNAVKHFKFEPRGKRRIHQKPDASEIEACRWWIEQERALIQPPLLVALGATAARSIFARTVTISRMRGQPHPMPDGSAGEAWVTVHPSFLLRIPEEDRKREEYRRFVGDLEQIGASAAKITA
ncbi:MAG: UdgX family uracil-DNA binding protein [Sphingosinicella sp.]